jgi:hypothetical protein
MKNYFEISENIFLLCNPYLNNYAIGKISIKELFNDLGPSINNIIEIDIREELKKCLGQYINFHWSAYKFKTMMDQTSFAPYWMYISDSPFCSHLHSSLDKLVFRFNDPFWNRYYVPNCWDCCCEVRNFTEEQLKQEKYRIHKRGERLVEIKPPYDINSGKRDWLPVYKKLFIQHLANSIYEIDNYEWNEEDEE